MIIRTTTLALAVIAIATTAHADTHGVKRDGNKHAQYFEKIDTNKDGSISLQEHQAYSSQKFLKMDANQDGLVSKDEAMAAKKEKRDKMKQRFQQRFKQPAVPKVPTPPAAPELNAGD